MALDANHATPARDVIPMTPVRAIVAMARPSQVLLIWVIFAAGVLLGLTRPGASTGVVEVALGALLVTGAAVAAHLVNEAEDAETDRLSARTAFSGGSGALQASGMAPSLPLRLGQVTAGVVTVGGSIAWLMEALPGTAVTVVLAGLVGALLYSLPPVAAMRHGWGEPLNALLGGMLLPLAGVAVVAGRVESADILAFLPLTLVVFASVMATAWPDRVADAATGKATMQVRSQPPALRLIHAAASLGAVLSMFVVAAVGAAPLALAGLLVAPALAVGVAFYTRRNSPLPNVAAMVGLAVVLLVAHAAAVLDGSMG